MHDDELNVGVISISPFPQVVPTPIEVHVSVVSVVEIARFTIPPTLAGPGKELVEGLAAELQRLVRESRHIVVRLLADASVPRAWPLFDMVLGEALYTLRDDLRGVKIVVVSDFVPVPTDDLAALAGTRDFAGEIVFCATIRDAMAALGAPEPPLSEREMSDRNAMSLRVGTFRRRGVFQARKGRSYYRYHYEALPSVLDDLVEMLNNYFVQEQIAVVLFDQGSGGDWFTSCLLRAAQGAGVPSLDARSIDLSPPDVRDDEGAAIRATRDLLVSGGSVCLAVPVCKTGGAIVDRLTALGGTRSRKGRILSIYFDTGGDDDLQPVAGFFRKRRAVQGWDVDFLLDVPVTLLSEASWEVRAAKVLGAGKSNQGEVPVETIGLLSLLGECECGVEIPVPNDRDPITVFPLLGSISDWDAEWLAEGLVDGVEKALDVDRSRLLFVLPEEAEQNATEPLRRAMETRLDTSVVTIRRAVIEGETPSSDEVRALSGAIQAWQSLVLLDESTVSMGTFMRMRKFLVGQLNADVLAAAVVLDLSSFGGTLGVPLIRLSAWRPQLTGSITE